MVDLCCPFSTDSRKPCTPYAFAYLCVTRVHVQRFRVTIMLRAIAQPTSTIISFSSSSFSSSSCSSGTTVVSVYNLLLAVSLKQLQPVTISLPCRSLSSSRRPALPASTSNVPSRSVISRARGLRGRVKYTRISPIATTFFSFPFLLWSTRSYHTCARLPSHCCLSLGFVLPVTCTCIFYP